jgi:hypothetical protein
MTTLKGWVQPDGSTRQSLDLPVDVRFDTGTTSVDIPGFGRMLIRWRNTNEGSGTLTWTPTQQVFTLQARNDPTRRGKTGIQLTHPNTGTACGECTLIEHPHP